MLVTAMVNVSPPISISMYAIPVAANSAKTRSAFNLAVFTLCMGALLRSFSGVVLSLNLCLMGIHIVVRYNYEVGRIICIFGEMGFADGAAKFQTR